MRRRRAAVCGGAAGMTTLELLAVMLLVGIIVSLCYCYEAMGRGIWTRGESQSDAQAAAQRAASEVTRLGRPARDVLAADPGNLVLRQRDDSQVALVLDASGVLKLVAGAVETVVTDGISAFEPQYDAILRELTVRVVAQDEDAPLVVVIHVQLRNHGDA